MSCLLVQPQPAPAGHIAVSLRSPAIARLLLHAAAPAFKFAFFIRASHRNERDDGVAEVIAARSVEVAISERDDMDARIDDSEKQ